jgi:hypothetical protein
MRVVTVNGDVYVRSIINYLNLNTSAISSNTATGVFTVEAGATLYIRGANNSPANFGGYDFDPTSTTNYDANINQTIGGIAYGNLSLTDVAKELGDAANFGKKDNPILSRLNKYGKALSAGISASQSSAAKLLLRSQGLAVNPNQQLMFDGIDFRTYQMAFTFTPYTKEEAETVKKIINTFKYHAAPEITTAGAGMFFIPPSTFDVSFMFNGKMNKNVNKVAESVLESVDVNYAPNGWAAHDDGAPVQTTLTLSFKEMELIDKTKIRDGY